MWSLLLGLLFFCKFFFPLRNSPLVGQDPPLSRFHDRRHTPHSAGLLWKSDQPDANTSIWQQTKITRDRHS